jgi:thiol-disulfide isomerase/thioredoxin
MRSHRTNIDKDQKIIMMKNIKTPFAIVTFFALFFITGNLKMRAQTALATVPEKKTEVAATPDELAKLRSAIEANPNDLAAHEAYLKATGFTKWGAAEDPEFVRQYEEWMKKFPTSAAVPYALGHAYAGKESPKAKPYLLKAVAIDPKFDKAWSDLWIDGERWGDFKLSASYLLKAKEAAPTNPDYAFYYANAVKETDFAKYQELSLAVAHDFPNTERGAQALYWLANRTNNVKDKITFYEQQKKDFPADKFSWTSSGMSEYFNLLLEQSPEKAVALSEYMIGLNMKGAKTWESNLKTAKKIGEAESLLAKGNAIEASALLDSVAVPRYSSAKEYILLLKSKAMDAAGKTSKAYDNLLTSYAKEPTESVNKQLIYYGSRLGKKENDVKKDVWYVRDTASRQAPVFNMETYLTKGWASLNDYKGKVVLITYWFPGCGPCRGEFPHFENVVKKFKGKDFVYLGINIVPDQDDYVVPFMKSSGYSFIPIKDNDKWTKGPMDNRNAAPVNFLIDQDGKIIFSNFRTDGKTEATLEIMIKSMLERKKTS